MTRILNGAPLELNITASQTKHTIDETDPMRALREENMPIYQQIQEMEKSLDQLREVHASNIAKMNRTLDPLARLPIELVRIIFTNLRPPSLEPSFCHHSPKFDEVSKAVMLPILLSSICRAWRDVAFTTADLWNTIFINIYNNSDTEVLRKWLERSSRHPLYMYLFAAGTENHSRTLSIDKRARMKHIMGVANEYVKRCIYLNLNIPVQFIKHVHYDGSRQTLLKSLTLRNSEYDGPGYGPDIRIETSSNLRHIHIHGISTDGLRMYWETVTRASCYFATTVPMVCRLLQRAPFLRHLVTGDLCDVTASTDVFPPFLHHHRLTYLEVTLKRLADDSEQSLLSRLVLPALKYLSVCAEGVRDLSPISDFVQRSACSLKQLNIEIGMSEVYSLPMLLEKIPSVEKLILDYQDDHPDGLILPPILPPPSVLQEIIGINEDRFLPRLKEVNIVVDYYPRVFRVDLDLHPPALTVPTLEPSSLKPLYLYHLLCPDILFALQPPIVENCFKDVDLDPSLGNMEPFKFFFTRFLVKYDCQHAIPSSNTIHCAY
ncbi:hypothetical protein BDN70DRAFT_885421 [Pholiota conissans]|uniref:F-box domain-containing protein n=1 Tax=Pholiota conissans TaxID=109636 RepID=A0A9P5YR28_9AGAR|nr:hypothetical protein BDN70DRAFT_885421 [Pholiota conissans]